MVAPPPGPLPSPKVKKAKKPNVAALRREKERVPTAKVVRREETEARLRHAAVPPPPAIVCKDLPCTPPPPVPIEPAVRLATWTQLYGDYEKRSATGTTVLLTTGPGFPEPQELGLALNAHSQTGTIGFLAGADLTSRGVLYENDGLIAGAMAGYVSSNLNLQTTSLPVQRSDPNSHSNRNGRESGLR